MTDVRAIVGHKITVLCRDLREIIGLQQILLQMHGKTITYINKMTPLNFFIAGNFCLLFHVG
jgi:hypothetical protein